MFVRRGLVSSSFLLGSLLEMPCEKPLRSAFSSGFSWPKARDEPEHSWWWQRRIVMAVERVSGNSNLIEVLDRILDKGIVLDAWVRISLMGIDLTTEDRVVVASSSTCLDYADPPGPGGPAAKPAQSEAAPQGGIGDGVSRPVRRRQ
jgi:hypothetical protein